MSVIEIKIGDKLLNKIYNTQPISYYWAIYDLIGFNYQTCEETINVYQDGKEIMKFRTNEKGKLEELGV